MSEAGVAGMMQCQPPAAVVTPIPWVVSILLRSNARSSSSATISDESERGMRGRKWKKMKSSGDNYAALCVFDIFEANRTLPMTEFASLQLLDCIGHVTIIKLMHEKRQISLATSFLGYIIPWLHHSLTTPFLGYIIPWLHHSLTTSFVM